MGYLTAILAALVASAFVLQQGFVHASFSDNCGFYWGPDRGQMTGHDSLELKLDQYGGSGINSYASYMLGSVTMQIKLPSGNSAGTVATFYLSSTGDKHDEIDFEFLGNSTGEPYTIHTNIFTQGVGGREQQFKAWFDPTDGFHNYTILWTPFSVVWYVDGVPIRVFRNYHDSEINFPDSQPMKAYASFWNADNWATQGGRIKTDWSLAPFTASFQNYKADACICPDANSVGMCYSPLNWWMNGLYYQLNEAELGQMYWVRDNYKIYDYCLAPNPPNGQYPKECNLPQF